MKKYSPQKDNISVVNETNKVQSVECLTPEIYNFRIDSYKICKTWFKARHGRPLDNEDTQCYQRIVIVLKEMVKLAEEIKTVFEYDRLKKLEIFEKVRFVITEKLGIEPNKINPMANFITDFGADSLEMLELVIALEEVFEIEISAQIAQTLVTVQQVINYISQKVQITV
jgi:acyl carrier protein